MFVGILVILLIVSMAYAIFSYSRYREEMRLLERRKMMNAPFPTTYNPPPSPSSYQYHTIKRTDEAFNAELARILDELERSAGIGPRKATKEEIREATGLSATAKVDDDSIHETDTVKYRETVRDPNCENEDCHEVTPCEDCRYTLGLMYAQSGFPHDNHDHVLADDATFRMGYVDGGGSLEDGE
jgi:hypothetical protein